MNDHEDTPPHETTGAPTTVHGRTYKVRFTRTVTVRGRVGSVLVSDPGTTDWDRGLCPGVTSKFGSTQIGVPNPTTTRVSGTLPSTVLDPGTLPRARGDDTNDRDQWSYRRRRPSDGRDVWVASPVPVCRTREGTVRVGRGTDAETRPDTTGTTSGPERGLPAKDQRDHRSGGVTGVKPSFPFAPGEWEF